jgi:signal transduction histidine kinase
MTVELSQSLILQVIDELSQEHDGVYELVVATCRVVSQPFERVRYYATHTENPALVADPEEMLVLLHNEHRVDMAGAGVGYRFPLSMSTIGPLLTDRIRRSQQASCPSHFQTNPAQDEILESLQLRGRRWVQTPVFSGSRTFGLLSADWPYSEPKLSKQSLEVLTSIGGILGGAISHYIHGAGKDLQRILRHMDLDVVDRATMLGHALSQLQSALNVASLSLFQYDWSRNVLERAWFSINPGPSNAGDHFKEEPYEAVRSKSLTGTAFLDDDHRRVGDFDSVPEHLRSAPSVKYHGEFLGKLYTVMYARAGTAMPVLLRAINHSTQVPTPFLEEHGMFQEYSEGLEYVLDIAFRRNTNSILRDLSDLRSSTQPARTRITLALERAREILLLEQLAFVSISNDQDFPVAVDIGFPNPGVAQTLADQATNLFNTSGLTVVRRQDSGPMRQAMGLTSQRQADLLLFVESVGHYRAALCMPVWDRPSQRLKRQHAAGQQDEILIPPAVETFLGELLDRCIRLLDVYNQDRAMLGVRRSLRVIGHEIAEPTISIRNVTDTLLGEIQRQPGSVHQTHLAHLLKSQFQLADARVRRTVEIATILARDEGGTIRGQMAWTDLGDVVEAVASRVGQELELALLRPPSGPPFVEYNRSEFLGTTVYCDAYLIELALLNILRNAVRYSSKDPPGPIELHMVEERRFNRIAIAVKNYGAEIDAKLGRAIFSMYVRGNDGESTPRDGMGVGLYISRLAVRAHNGDISFAQEPHLRDHLTTFRMTISTNLGSGLVADGGGDR